MLSSGFCYSIGILLMNFESSDISAGSPIFSVDHQENISYSVFVGSDRAPCMSSLSKSLNMTLPGSLVTEPPTDLRKYEAES